MKHFSSVFINCSKSFYFLNAVWNKTIPYANKLCAMASKRTNISPRPLSRLKLLELFIITHHKLLEVIMFLSFKSNKIGWEIVTSIFNWLFISVLSGICSQSSGEGPKGRFIASDMPENHTNEKKRKNRKCEEKKKRRRGKSNGCTLTFISFFLATLFWTK